MYIIGTAGHVDHGKTLLIKALTGIDTDRLPEEKKRGLTIDLGFAHYKDQSGAEIGIVDVPGHERFIRNMTAGAWGIDLALLVVAADDGWMYQTGNHLRVLMAMDITNLIAVITKTDMVPAERTAETIEDAQLRLLEATGREYPAIGVSSTGGDNIDELKELITAALSSGTGNNGKTGNNKNRPLMHIDRAFSISGAGLIVTGSLREGPVKKNDSLTLLPSGKTVRIRGIQTYDTETDTAEPACRAALNLSGADANEVKRGCCITAPGSGFTAEKELIIELNGESGEIRNHTEAEFASGTAHTIGSIHFLKRQPGRPLRARLNLNERLPLRLEQPIVVIRKGGSLITGSGRVIWKGETSVAERSSIASAEKTDSVSMELAVRGWAEIDGRYIFDTALLERLETQVLQLASTAGGLKRDELPGKTGLPAEPLEQYINELLSAGKITEQNGLLFSGTPGRAELSNTAAQLLKEMERAGKEGYDIKKSRIPGAQKELRTLTREGLIVPLTGTLFISEKVFSELCAAMMKGLSKGDSFDIAHAKDSTGLSRKYIIPLLNKMEEKGLVTREENIRRVL